MDNKCSRCGHALQARAYRDLTTGIVSDYHYYCPSCGSRIEREVKDNG